jgi:hypothetical protein
MDGRRWVKRRNTGTAGDRAAPVSHALSA